MSIKILNDDEHKITIELKGWRLIALRKAMSIWGFLDVQSAIRFILSILFISRKDSIFVKEKNKNNFTQIEPIHKETIDI